MKSLGCFGTMFGKNKAIIFKHFFSYAFLMQGCNNDISEHKVIFSKLDSDAHYELFDSLYALDQRMPIRSGRLGNKFVNCLKRAEYAWNVGGASNTKTQYLKITYKLDKDIYIKIKVTGREIDALLILKEKTSSGQSGLWPMIKISCGMRDLP